MKELKFNLISISSCRRQISCSWQSSLICDELNSQLSVS